MSRHQHSRLRHKCPQAVAGCAVVSTRVTEVKGGDVEGSGPVYHLRLSGAWWTCTPGQGHVSARSVATESDPRPYGHKAVWCHCDSSSGSCWGTSNSIKAWDDHNSSGSSKKCPPKPFLDNEVWFWAWSRRYIGTYTGFCRIFCNKFRAFLLWKALLCDVQNGAWSLSQQNPRKPLHCKDSAAKSCIWGTFGN